MVGSLFFLTSVVTANEVVSTNIVGYLVNTNVPPSYLTGPTFVPVLSCLQDNPDFTILLEDITIEGMHLSFDSIQFLSPEDSSTIVEAVYSSIPAIKGWWKLGSPGVESLDKTPISLSEGFLCNFASGNNITLTYAGEVFTGETSITLTNMFSVLANYLPVDLKLKHITAEGMHLSFDSIQFLSPDDSSTIIEAVYSSIPAIKGWWKLGSPGVESLDDIDFPAGAAILCNFQSGNSVKFTFPDPMLPLVP